MLTVARCTRAAVWTQVTVWAETVCGAEDQSKKAQRTLPNPREPLQSLVVIADEILSIPGMEYCLKHSLECSPVMGLGHKTFAARARLGMQGTSMIVHDAGDAVCVGSLHTGSVALLASADLCCRARFEGIWRGRIAGESMADLSGVGYKDLQAITCRRVPTIYVGPRAADSGRVVAEVPRGLKVID
jgi:hypothetical protein